MKLVVTLKLSCMHQRNMNEYGTDILDLILGSRAPRLRTRACTKTFHVGRAFEEDPVFCCRSRRKPPAAFFRSTGFQFAPRS
jgi:hypothetical protein